MDEEEVSKPAFDEELAASYIGKYMLVGLTYIDSGGNTTRQEQKHGEIVRINQREGIILQLDNGEFYALPPALDALRQANPGIYRLRSNGDEIEDPDLLSTWTITPSESQGN